MFKTLFKILVCSLFLSLLVKCDNYEFPERPYPKVETLPVTNISKTAVTFQANIIHINDEPITNHGFLWGLEENLFVNSIGEITLGSPPPSGFFEVDLATGLSDGTTYYVTGFVSTDSYLVYGEVVSFTVK